MNTLKRLSHDVRVRHSLSWSLLVLILLGIVLGIGRATKKIDYIWQWQRMPRYIFFKKEIDITAADPGTILSIRDDGKDKVVILRTFDGKDETYRIPSGNVQVYEGDDLDSEDIIGSYKKWGPGILLIGLWLTLKMSFISVILAVFIGLITGLARISSRDRKSVV